MTYTKFCENCKNILTLGEMEGSICDRCKEEKQKLTKEE